MLTPDLITRLRCPFCGSSLTIKGDHAQDDEIRYGVAQCDCYRHPIVEGVLVLNPTNLTAQTAQAIEQGDNALALLHMLNLQRSAWHRGLERIYKSGRFGRTIRFIKKRAYRSLIKPKPDETFWSALSALKFSSWGIYLAHRLSSEKYHASLPLLAAFPKNAERILDFGCGAGHHLFDLGRMFPKADLIGLDTNFVSLLIAKKYLAPKAALICHNGNYPLPFMDQEFDAALSSDTLYNLRTKTSVLTQMDRVCKEQAPMVFAHQHPPGKKGLEGENSLPPSWFKEQLGNRCCICLPEQKLFDDFVDRGGLDLTEDYCQDVSLQKGNFSVLCNGPQGRIIENAAELVFANVKTAIPSSFYVSRVIRKDLNMTFDPARYALACKRGYQKEKLRQATIVHARDLADPINRLILFQTSMINPAPEEYNARVFDVDTVSSEGFPGGVK